MSLDVEGGGGGGGGGSSGRRWRGRAGEYEYDELNLDYRELSERERGSNSRCCKGRAKLSSTSLLLLAFGLSIGGFLFGSAFRGHINSDQVSDSGGSGRLRAGSKRPLVIGHRGSCGMLPEHTLEGYELAMKQGADCIECDVILTKDGVPICRHDLTLENTTDVATRPEFRHKVTKRMVEGKMVEGYFAVDFTLAEIKELRALQRMSFRDPNFNGKFEIATLQEQIDLVTSHQRQHQQGEGKKTKAGEVGWHLKLLNYFLGFPDVTPSSSAKAKEGRETGKTCLYPEMKSTAWHNSLNMWNGQRSEDIILGVLRENSLASKDDNIYLQSFETLDLQYVHAQASLKLIQLIGLPGEIQWDTKRPYTDLLRPKGMEAISEYAFAVSPGKVDILPVNETTGYIDSIETGREFVKMVHATGLEVHPWVLRDEDRYLAWNYGQDAYNEYAIFVNDLGVDGFFTDFPQTATNFLNHF